MAKIMALKSCIKLDFRKACHGQALLLVTNVHKLLMQNTLAYFDRSSSTAEKVLAPSAPARFGRNWKTARIRFLTLKELGLTTSSEANVIKLFLRNCVVS
jgi:hypothetical protein